MPIARLSPQAMHKAITSGAGEQFANPRAWMQASYGPGQPVRPISATQDVAMPRSIDFPIAVNSSLNPRSGWAGLMSFLQLYQAYENVTEVRNPVSTFWRTMTSFVPRLVDADNNEISDHPYKWLTESPDRENPFNVWLTRFLKSAKIYDAPAVYMRKDANGMIDAMKYIDGSTLFVIVNEFGEIPKPQTPEEYYADYMSTPHPTHPVSRPIEGTPTTIGEFIDRFRDRLVHNLPVPAKIPAFTQIIKGTPFAWWDSEQIWYQPTNRRVNAPYGESFIEQAWTWIQIVVSITAFELGHYKTGNMPEGFVTMPSKNFDTADRLLAAEIAYNARMSSNPETERMRLRFFPDGAKYFPTKKPDFPIALYKQATQNILHAAGIPPSEYGDVPGQGLGGKGFKEGSLDDLARNMINPARAFIASVFNEVLRRDGVTDVKFDMGYPSEEVDPDKLKQDVYDGMAHGTLSLNDGMGALGMNPVGDPNDPDNIANKHLIVAGSTIFVIEDMETNGTGMAVPTFGGGQLAGGAPAGPETAALQSGAEHTPQDFASIAHAIRNMMDSGTLDGKTISIPNQTFFKRVDPDPGKSVRVEQVVALLEAHQANQHRLLPNNFVAEPEKIEPVEVIVDVAPTILDKHCGVCPEDDDYFGAPISREITLPFPNLNHANGVEIVAMCPEGLPPKAALWKPEGDELENLQEWVGGPQYVREEAAYLLDRALGFMLVPLAYVAFADGEVGAAVYYTPQMGDAKDVSGYAPAWIERAAVFDYITSQLDRGYHHNYGTHPDDPTRLILFDNGLAFPVADELYCQSLFCTAWVNMPLSEDVLLCIMRLMGDASVWSDIRRLVGDAAVGKARICAQRLLDERMITVYEADHAGSDA